MAVRNFWIEATIDGRQTELEGGPRRKDGGFVLKIYQRHEGGIEKPVEIHGYVLSDGETLCLSVKAAQPVPHPRNGTKGEVGTLIVTRR